MYWTLWAHTSGGSRHGGAPAWPQKPRWGNAPAGTPTTTSPSATPCVAPTRPGVSVTQRSLRYTRVVCGRKRHDPLWRVGRRMGYTPQHPQADVCAKSNAFLGHASRVYTTKVCAGGTPQVPTGTGDAQRHVYTGGHGIHIGFTFVAGADCIRLAHESRTCNSNVGQPIGKESVGLQERTRMAPPLNCEF